MSPRLLLIGLVIMTLPAPPVAAQEVDYAQRFRVFTGQGEPATLADIGRAMAAAEVVFVGEAHTDPVGHFIEAELLREALAYGRAAARPVALSLEMFERDVQLVVDEYLRGLIPEDQFTRSARAWDYYASDYRPLVELAKAAGAPVIAANAPRRYVNRVTRLGRDALDELSAEARRFLPPLPYPEPSARYRGAWLALMAAMPMQPRCVPPTAAAAGQARPDSAATVPPHPPAGDAPRTMPSSHGAAFMENGLHAQALWDAAMAHAVASHLAAQPGTLVLHMVGGFHVENFTGIPEQVQHYRPQTRSLVVSLQPAADFGSFDPKEHTGQGDYVILTDQSLDQDYQRNCLGPGRPR